MVVTTLIRLSGIEAVAKRFASYGVSRLMRRYYIRTAIDRKESRDQTLENDLKQAFGAAGQLNTTTDRVLRTVATSRLLDHLIDAAIVGIDPSFARKLIDRLELEYSPNESVSLPPISERLWSIATRLSRSELDGLKPLRRPGEQHSRIEDRVRRTEAQIAQSMSTQAETAASALNLPDSAEQSRIMQVLSDEAERICTQVDVHGASGEVLRVDLDDIFVGTPLEHLGSYQDAIKIGSSRDRYYRHSALVKWQVFLTNIGRTVLLGDPGGGKSTLSKKLCLEAAKASQEGGTLSPVFLQLRTFVAEWDQNRGLEFIEYIADGVQAASPDIEISSARKIIHHLLATGRMFVVFDGLDEVLSLGNREEITKRIRVFCERYPLSRFLLTSRVVGYESTPVRNFEHFLVRELNRDGISDLFERVTKAIIGGELRSSTRFEEFYQDAQNKIEELMSNPLLLTLIIIIHSKKREIPDNRVDIYAACADLLFDRWDGFRNINPDLPERFRLYDLLMHLASVIFENESLGGRLSKEALRKEAKLFFRNDYIDNREGRAAVAANKLVEHLTGRAWILHEVGEDIFEFTHRTFLEYFYSRYLEGKHEKTEELLNSILSYIYGGQRVLSSHLALQLRVKNKRSAASVVAGMIAQEIERRGSGQTELLSFSAAALEYLLPDAISLATLAERIARVCIDDAHFDPLAVVLRTRSPLRQIIVEPVIKEIASVGRLEDIRSMQRVYESLYRHSSDADTAGAVDRYLLPSLQKRQSVSPFAVKLIIDLSREPDWELAFRYGLRLWRANKNAFPRIDPRAEDASKIMTEAKTKPQVEISRTSEPLIYLASELWKRIDEHAGKSDYNIISGGVLYYMPPNFDQDINTIKNMNSDRLSAFIFGAIMACEYYEKLNDDYYFRNNYGAIFDEIRINGNFPNIKFFDRWLNGSISLFSKDVPRHSRKEYFLALKEQHEQIEKEHVLDDEEEIFF